MSYPFTGGNILNASELNEIGLFHVKTETISGTPSSVTITSAFSSTFDNYRIIGHALDTTGSGNDIEMELGNGGSHTTGYYGNITRFQYNVSGSSSSNFSNVSPMPIAYDNATAGATHLDVTLYRPNVSAPTSWSQKGGSIRGIDVNGYYSQGQSFTSVTFECTVGTWTGGEFRVYGIVNG